ncbi:4880_t:CDS:2, partial [Dentiscutata erythropus]
QPPKAGSAIPNEEATKKKPRKKKECAIPNEEATKKKLKLT